MVGPCRVSEVSWFSRKRRKLVHARNAGLGGERFGDFVVKSMMTQIRFERT